MTRGSRLIFPRAHLSACQVLSDDADVPHPGHWAGGIQAERLAEEAGMTRSRDAFDAVVIGSGFGGLGAALRLAELGARVVVCESLKYPGGCASTFSHRGYRFDAGATLLAGLGEGQLFSRWLERHGETLEVESLDPVLTLRTPDFELSVPSDRRRLREALLALPGVPQDRRLGQFLALQEKVAEALWPVLDDPDLLPPFGRAQLLRHLRRLPTYLPLIRWLGRPLTAVLEHHGLGGCKPLRQWLDAVCQITVQCSADRAEALVALATVDYFFRGAAHVRGGVGELAWAMVRAIENCGGEVRFAHRVKSLARHGDTWRVETRRGPLTAGGVVANLLPHDLRRLLESGGLAPQERSLGALEKAVEEGWGAAMLYRVVRAPGDVPPEAQHLEIIQDAAGALTEGQHLFASLSSAAETGRAGEGLRTLTVSTHVPMRGWRQLPDEAKAAQIDLIHHRMRAGLRKHAPHWWNETVFETTASPRTFARFTGRRDGMVGGVPRHAGLGNYLAAFRRPAWPGLEMVGDSVFPGQSALATAAGGAAAARRLWDHRATRRSNATRSAPDAAAGDRSAWLPAHLPK